MRLEGEPPGGAPPELRLRFLHATRSGADRDSTLRRGADGAYRGTIEPLLPGRYHVQLETEAWRLVGELAIPGEGGAALLPAS